MKTNPTRNKHLYRFEKNINKKIEEFEINTRHNTTDTTKRIMVRICILQWMSTAAIIALSYILIFE